MTHELLHDPDLLDYLNSHDLPGFYQADQFKFLKEIEDNIGTIKDEWNSVNLDKTLYQPWVQQSLLSDPSCWELIVLNSRQSHLHKINNVENNNPPLDINDHILPNTFELLSRVLGTRLCDVVISKLRAGTKILPHRGIFSNALRAHIGLQLPAGDCKIIVNNEIQTWIDGKILIIDDRLVHEVWNNTDQDRIVLIFDFIPDPMPGFFPKQKIKGNK
jgi:aspartyl/asparaginyl beta-hydroxylase (cupin superfamily)